MGWLNTQSIAIAASTVALAISGVMVAPSMGQAKTEAAPAKPTTAPAKTEMAPTKPAAGKESGGASLVEQLKLTDKQKKDIAGIRRNRTIAINKILTPEQKTKFEAARKAGKSTSDTMKELSLKPDQKKQILEAMKTSADSIKGVLTPDQQKQLVTYLKNRQGGLE
jgi:periplasmic protein CpxP/Spy